MSLNAAAVNSTGRSFVAAITVGHVKAHHVAHGLKHGFELLPFGTGGGRKSKAEVLNTAA